MQVIQRFNGRKLKKLFFISLAFLVLLLLLIQLLYTWVERSTQKFVAHQTNELPHCKAALVLGTSHRNKWGGANLFFKYRMQAAYQLYQSGKVDYLVLSGDNRKATYNEPEEMRKHLLVLGVPDTALYLDYAGFRTFDSVVRMKAIFGQQRFILVSQPFHVQRALFIAQHKGLEAMGFPEQDVPSNYSLSASIREYGARVKMLLDLYVLQTEPHFYGPEIGLGK